MELVIQKTVLMDYMQMIPLTEKFQDYFTWESIPQRVKLAAVSQSMLADLCDKINSQEIEGRENADRWKFGEYRLFIWFAVYYAINNRKAVQQLNEQDFRFLQTIFLQKSQERMKYELLCFYPPKGSGRSKWSFKEVTFLKRLVQEEGNPKKVEWKRISLQLYLQSQGKYFKTFGQCREMWLNHLNPSLKKKRWTKEEDLLLLTLYRQESRSWARIAKKFNQSRTAHMIKNRYHSLVRRSKKCYKLMKIQQIEAKLMESLTRKIEKERQVTQAVLPEQLIAHSTESSQLQQSDNQTPFYQDSDQIYNDQKGEQKQQESGDSQLENVLDLGKDLSEQIQKQDELKVENLLIDKPMLDLSMLQISKSVASDELLQKLGCVHIEQLEEAFQQIWSWGQPIEF